MLSFLLTFIVMFIVWFSLSGQTAPMFLILGVVSCLLVAYWSHDLLISKMYKGPNLRRIILILRYFPWLAWQVVLANKHLIYLVLNPKMPIEPTIIRFKHTLKTDACIALLANSITLTPGTITIDVDRDEYIVHAVSKETAKGLLSGSMQNKIYEIENGVRR